MVCKTVEYEDFSGNKRTQKLYFNLTRAEMAEYDMDLPGGLQGFFKAIVEESDNRAIMKAFKELISRSYGEKTADGRFVKSDDIRNAFFASEAYSEFLMNLCENAEQAAEFVNGIIPKLPDTPETRAAMEKAKAEAAEKIKAIEAQQSYG